MRHTETLARCVYDYQLPCRLTLLCAVSKLIVKVFPTTAKVHDAKVIDRYLHWAKDSKKEVLFFADAGYTGKKIVEKLLEANMPPLIVRKAAKVFR